MKFIKVLSLTMACLLMCLCIASCGSNAVKVNVKLSVFTRDANGEENLLCGPFEGEIKGTTDNPPTVLQAAKEILEANSVPCEYDDTSITSIQSEKQGMKDGETYAWIFTLNGKEPQNTRSYNTTLSEGDVIVYYLTSIENDNPAGADTNS